MRELEGFELLDAVEEGAYGWVLYESFEEGVISVWYDDDDIECVCGDEECSEWGNDDGEEPPYDPNKPLPDHFGVWKAIIYRHPEDLYTGGPCAVIDGGDMRAMTATPSEVESAAQVEPIADPPPAGPVPEREWQHERRGWVYVVALAPDVAANRIKVGWTGSPIEKRLASFRTTSPTCRVLATWPGTMEHEKAAHMRLTGRIGHSEVFDVPDVDAAIALVESVLVAA